MSSLQRAPGSLKSEQMGHMKGQEKRHKDMGVEGHSAENKGHSVENRCPIDP